MGHVTGLCLSDMGYQKFPQLVIFRTADFFSADFPTSKSIHLESREPVFSLVQIAQDWVLSTVVICGDVWCQPPSELHLRLWNICSGCRLGH